MSGLATYVLVLAVYLGLQFGIGVVASRRMKQSGEGFHLGSRAIGPWVTALSFVSAYFSSVVVIGGGGYGYKYGMGTLWIGASNVVVGALLAWIVLGQRTRRMTARLGSVTLSEFLGRRYAAPEARWLSAAVIGLFLALYSVSVLQGMGQAFSVLMGVPYVTSLLVSSLVIVVYVAMGGYLAVVWTGFFQALVMFGGLLLLTAFAVAGSGGLEQVAIRLAAIDGGRYVQSPGPWGWAGLGSFAMIVSFGVWGMPQLVSRFYSIRSVEVLKLGTVLATVGAATALLPYFNGALARIHHPTLANADSALPVLVRDALPPWAAAVFLAGVIAAGMSTFAAVLITASGAVVRDLVRDTFNVPLDPKQDLRVSRQVSIIIGLAALLVAIKPPAMILTITGFSWAAIASSTLWPYVLGLYWRRATRPAAVASMAGGFLTAMAWMTLRNPFRLHGFVPGVVVSLVLMVAVSLLTSPPARSVVDLAFRGPSGSSASD